MDSFNRKVLKSIGYLPCREDVSITSSAKTLRNRCLPPQRGHLQVQGKAVSARPFCVHGREACAGPRHRGGPRVHLGGWPFCDSGLGAHKKASWSERAEAEEPGHFIFAGGQAKTTGKGFGRGQFSFFREIEERCGGVGRPPLVFFRQCGNICVVSPLMACRISGKFR